MYLFINYLLCVLAVVSLSRDRLSEATHAKDSGDPSVRVWQGESRFSMPGEWSQFKSGTHSFHCLTQKRLGYMGLGASPSSVPQHLCHLEKLFSLNLRRDPD